MKNITEVEILDCFKGLDGNTHGVYKCKFKGHLKFFIVSNNLVYVLCHYFDGAGLEIVNNEVRDEFLELLEGKLV